MRWGKKVKKKKMQRKKERTREEFVGLTCSCDVNVKKSLKFFDDALEGVLMRKRQNKTKQNKTVSENEKLLVALMQ